MVSVATAQLHCHCRKAAAENRYTRETLLREQTAAGIWPMAVGYWPRCSGWWQLCSSNRNSSSVLPWIWNVSHSYISAWLYLIASSPRAGVSHLRPPGQIWPPADLVNKVLLEYVHTHWLLYGLWLLPPPPHQQSWIVVTETPWSPQPEIITLWPVTENVCYPSP